MCPEQRVVSNQYRNGYDCIQWSSGNENQEGKASQGKETKQGTEEA